MSAVRTFNTHHETLGQITGRLIDDKHLDGQKATVPVVHFRSIPYATVPQRFRQSVQLNHLPDTFDGREKGNFTEYGAACPQIPQPKGRGSASGDEVPGVEPLKYEEFTCLNLTISTPVSALEEKKQLPVMVYVHGGAFTEGSGHVSSQHDTVKMAELASKEGMGVVVVSVGYRLNWQGFAACTDLLEEAEEVGEPAFNFGLRDQRAAFLWIQQNIAGFGGNPSQVTAFGESAGGSSLYMQACSDAPIFSRLIIQSGSPTVAQQLSLKDHDVLYQKLLDYLGIQSNSRKERLGALRSVPVDRLIDFNREHGVPLMPPYLGPEAKFCRQQPYWTNQARILSECKWLEEVMVGDDFYEGWIFTENFATQPPQGAVKALIRDLGEDSARRVLDAYEIREDMDPNLFLQNAALLVGDLIFSEPCHTTALELARRAKESGKKVYRWHFCLPNPFAGSSFQFVTGHHFVELFYQFMTLTSRYPTHRNHFLRRQAEEMARIWIRFANGLQPMPDSAYDLDDEKIMICDMLEGWTVRTREQDERISQNDPWGPRRYRQWDTLAEEIRRSAKRAEIVPGGSDDEKCEAVRNALINLSTTLRDM